MSESGANGIKIPPSFRPGYPEPVRARVYEARRAWLRRACFHGRADYGAGRLTLRLSPNALTLHPADLETADKTSSLVAFLIEHMRGRGGFLDHRSILLGHLIHLFNAVLT